MLANESPPGRAGHLLRYGGQTVSPGGEKPPNTFKFEPAQNEWQSILSLTLPDPTTNEYPSPRYYHTAVFSSLGYDKMIVYGGTNATLAAFEDTWELDLRLLQWRDLTPTFPKGTNTFPTGRYQHSAAVHPGTGDMYVVGGRVYASYIINSDIVWKLSYNTVTGTYQWTRISLSIQGRAQVSLTLSYLSFIYLSICFNLSIYVNLSIDLPYHLILIFTLALSGYDARLCG